MLTLYKILFLFVIFLICIRILPQKYEPFKNEFFEQVKIKLKPNPLNINLNNNIIGYGGGGGGEGGCGTNNYPDVIVPIYSPWRTYWNTNSFNPYYPYYPYYPFYYNNYFTNY